LKQFTISWVKSIDLILYISVLLAECFAQCSFGRGARISKTREPFSPITQTHDDNGAGKAAVGASSRKKGEFN